MLAVMATSKKSSTKVADVETVDAATMPSVRRGVRRERTRTEPGPGAITGSTGVKVDPDEYAKRAEQAYAAHQEKLAAKAAARTKLADAVGMTLEELTLALS